MHERPGKRGPGNAGTVHPQPVLARLEALVFEDQGFLLEDAPSRGSGGHRFPPQALGEPVLEDHLCGHRVVTGSGASLPGEALPRFPRREPFVHEMDRHSESPGQLVAESPCEAGRVLLRAVHVERQADDHRLRFPPFDESRDGRPLGNRVAGGKGSERCRGAREGLTHRDADVPLPVVECEEGLRGGVSRLRPARHAWPT